MAFNRRFTSREGYLPSKYKKLKGQVYKRDKGMCRMPNCKRKGRQMHHIRRWADCPELRYSIDNTILLCKQCHDKVFSKEDEYAPLFLRLISKTVDEDILKIKYGL